MFADHQRLRSGKCDDLRAQQTEFAVANHRNAILACQGHALENAASGGERFGKRGVLVGNVVRNRDQIHSGKLKKLSMRAIPAADP